MSTLVGEQLALPKDFSLESPGIDFNGPAIVEPAAEPERTKVTLTTSRRELWAFYLYYVVCPRLTFKQSEPN